MVHIFIQSLGFVLLLSVQKKRVEWKLEFAGNPRLSVSEVVHFAGAEAAVREGKRSQRNRTPSY